MGLVSWLDSFDKLRAEIRAGKVPAEFDLEDHPLRRNCPDSDWQEVLRLLQQEGLVDSSASRVAAPRARSIRTSSFLSDYHSQGRSPSIQTISIGMANWSLIPPELKTIDETGDALEPFVRHVHVQAVDDLPHALCESYVPMKWLGPSWSELENGKADMFDLWTANGQQPIRKEERLTFDWASPEESALLGLESTQANPVIRLSCVVWSRESILEYCLLTDRADLYEFRYTVPVEH